MFSYRYVISKHLFLFIGCAPSFGISGVSAIDNMKSVPAPMTMTVKDRFVLPRVLRRVTVEMTFKDLKKIVNNFN